MRLQLALAVLAVLTLGAATPARGDGTLTMRGVYYKERATRVMQPMLDAMFDAGAHGIATGHFLVDAITSASASSGAADAAAFTEQRYEGSDTRSRSITSSSAARSSARRRGTTSSPPPVAPWNLGRSATRTSRRE